MDLVGDIGLQTEVEGIVTVVPSKFNKQHGRAHRLPCRYLVERIKGAATAHHSRRPGRDAAVGHEVQADALKLLDEQLS